MDCFNKSFAALALAVSVAAASGTRAQIAPAPAQSAEKPMTIRAAHSAAAGRLTLTGNAQGQAILKNTATGATQIFQADATKWVREVFLLDGGKTVGAAQYDHTVFWDAKTGRETGRIPARVYGVSHNQKFCLAQTATRYLQLYAYPSLRLLGQLTESYEMGVNRFIFSPDDRYALVEHALSRAESEDSYPRHDFVFSEETHAKLYDLVKVKAVEAFNYYMIDGIGTFSADSRFINMGDVLIQKSRDFNNKPDSTWQFDIGNETLTKTH